MNPDSGKLVWYATGIDTNSMCASVIAKDDVVYAVGGRSGGALAVKAGGKGDVTETHVVWTETHRGRTVTPVLHEGLLYWVARGVANCVDAKTGERVYQERLSGSGSSTAGSGEGDRDNQRDRRRGGFGGGGGAGGQDYASPVFADGKIIAPTRTGEIFVYAIGSEFKTLARNRFESDRGEVSATPAISDGQLFIRSSKAIYCVAAE